MKQEIEVTNSDSVFLSRRVATPTGIPRQRLFKVKAAAAYLGIHEQTLRKLTDEGLLAARKMGTHRVFALEELDRYIDSLPRWYYGDGERSEASNDEEPNDQQSD